MCKKHLFLSAIGITLLGSAAVLAQGQPQMPMSFFIASTVPGGGNLGGLAGADQICQNLAASAGAGNRTWHAYLSQQAQGNTPSINARGRIGQGPWYNAKGQLVASNVADLHGDQQRDRNNIKKATGLTEKGAEVNGVGQMPNQHDILTGSDSDGRAFTDGIDHTCNNWTSDGTTTPTTNNAQGQPVPGTPVRAMLGHFDRNGGNNTSWNAAHMSRDCTKDGLIATGGAGKIYCFAIN